MGRSRWLSRWTGGGLVGYVDVVMRAVEEQKEEADTETRGTRFTKEMT
jgi:hypothetical protein